MKNSIIVSIDKELLQTIFEYAKQIYPKEIIFLLRGKKKKDMINITELIVPPLATYGLGFASIPLHTLSIDFSIIGTVHSHFSGDLNPSTMDLNHFFGSILMIVGFPFIDERNVAVYDHKGQKLTLEIKENL